MLPFVIRRYYAILETHTLANSICKEVSIHLELRKAYTETKRRDRKTGAIMSKKRKLVFYVEEDMYKTINDTAKDLSLPLSTFLRATMDITVRTKLKKIEMKDIDGIKYVYPMGMFVNAIKHHFANTNADNKQLISYVNIMTNGITNFINAIAFADDYEIPLELEQNYIDAINTFVLWLDNNQLTEYNVKKLGERLKQQLKEK